MFSLRVLKGEFRCGVNLLYVPIFAKMWSFKNRFLPEKVNASRNGLPLKEQY